MDGSERAGEGRFSLFAIEPIPITQLSCRVYGIPNERIEQEMHLHPRFPREISALSPQNFQFLFSKF